MSCPLKSRCPPVAWLLALVFALVGVRSATGTSLCPFGLRAAALFDGTKSLMQRIAVPQTPGLSEICDSKYCPPFLRSDVIQMLSYIHQIGRVSEAISADFTRAVAAANPTDVVELGAGSGDLTVFLARQLPSPKPRCLVTDLFPEHGKRFARLYPDLDPKAIAYLEYPVSFSNFDTALPLGERPMLFSMGVSHHIDDEAWIDHLRRLDRAGIPIELAYDMHDRSLWSLMFAMGVVFPTMSVPLLAPGIRTAERWRMFWVDMIPLLGVVAWDSTLSALKQRQRTDWERLIARAGVPYSIELRGVGDRFDLVNVVELRRN